jgi:ubiquinone/menaquinone biosynthesis C-methylase UbiE
MDYGDYKAGASSDFFWFKGKRGLVSVLLEKAGLERPLRILNAGAGTGDDISVIRGFGEIYVVDMMPEALEMVPAELVAEKKMGDITALDYPDGFFDAVVAFDLLEHVEDDAKAVAEIHRVLKPGGRFVFTVPAFNFMMSAHDRRLGHFRRYNMKSIGDLLAEFQCARKGYWMSSLFPLLLVSRLLDRFRKPENSFPYVPALADKIFYRMLSLENRLIRAGLRFPVGTTIYGICTRQ